MGFDGRPADVVDDVDEFLEKPVILFAGFRFNTAGDIDRVRLHGVDGFDHILRRQTAG